MERQPTIAETLAAPRVTIFGVGGAGGNAVAKLLACPDQGLRVLCANTDLQALRAVPKTHRLQLGRRLTSGLGAGAKPDIGRLAAEEALPEIKRALQGTSLCFIAAGMGGGTGTGAAPVIARAARAMGVLTIAVATKPFAFEGARRNRVANAGIALLEDSVDALVVVCNEQLIRVAGFNATLRDALAQSDAIVCESAGHFASLVAGPALKRISIADMRAILSSGGRTVMGYGEARFGADRALHAAQSALRNPLLEGGVAGARRLIVTVAGGEDLRFIEVEEAVTHLREHVCADAEIVWGSVIDPALNGRVRVGIAAAGLTSVDRFEPPMVDNAAIGKQSTHALSGVLAAMTANPDDGQGHPTPFAATVFDAPPVVAPIPSTLPASRRDLFSALEDGKSAIAAEVASDLGARCRLQKDSGKAVRSRHQSASLIDRIYFAAKQMRRGLGKRKDAITSPLGKRGPRVFRPILPALETASTV